MQNLFFLNFVLDDFLRFEFEGGTACGTAHSLLIHITILWSLNTFITDKNQNMHFISFFNQTGCLKKMNVIMYAMASARRGGLGRWRELCITQTHLKKKIKLQ